jgi:pantothenate kinase type III
MTAGESTLLIDMGNSRVKWALANESTRDVGEPFANRW